MKYKISLVTGLRDNHPEDLTVTYEELVNKLTTFPTAIIPKFDNQGFVAGHFGKKQRLTSNLISRTLITLDLDSYNSDLTSLKGVLKRDLGTQWYIAYSTASHTLKTPKIRIVILLEKEIPTDKYRAVVTNFVDCLELKPFLDEASYKPNQFMYFPTRSSECYEQWSYVNVGELLNPDYYMVDDGMSNITQMPFEQTSITSRKKKIVDTGVDNVLTTLRNQPLNITPKQINEALGLYKAESTNYHTWIEVGMALHHQFSGKAKGLQAWYDWSKLDSRYDKKKIYNEVKEKWASFNENKNPIRFSTIMKKVQESKVVNFNSKAVNKKNNAPLINSNIPRHKFVHTRGETLTPLSTFENFKILLDEYKIDIKYDVILKRQVVNFNGVIESDINKATTRLKSLCEQNSMKTSSVPEYMNVAEQEVNTWREWIEHKPWDGVDRFDDLCATVRVIEEHEETKKKYLRTWLMQMIHLTCLNDGLNGKMGRMVLVFQSAQWGGKTTWLKSLCPPTHQKYLQEGVTLDTKDPMSVLECIQNVFVELGEIASTFKKSDVDNLKNFISKTTDVLNMKYLTHHKEFRRRTVFFGSVNEHVFLQDTTGNTRYLALPILSCDYEHNIDMQQLYAQLYQSAKNGEGYNMDEKLIIEQKKLNSEFENESYLEQKFCDMFNTEAESRDLKMTLSSILELLGFMPGAIKQNHMTEMSRILTKLGYNRQTRSPRAWFLPPRR